MNTIAARRMVVSPQAVRLAMKRLGRAQMAAIEAVSGTAERGLIWIVEGFGIACRVALDKSRW
jgi:DNA-binding FadR family transcriptional regulator